MLGDISPQTVRITQQAVVYPGRDHVTSLRVERFDGRTYKPVDMTAVTRVILSFPEADPVIVYDSSVQAVFTHVGATLTVDLSDYAMPASVLGCQIILYDAEHPAGQVLVDDIDAVVQFDFRNVSVTGGTPPPAVEYITDAPTDGVTYARKDGVWVPVDAMVSGVSSVNGQSGVVVLDAADVGADAAGTATTAAAAAVAAHTVLADPHPQYLTPAEANVAYERVLTAGTNVTIDRTNPSAPVINASGGGGGGAVDSVNGQTGVVVLDAADVGADVAGAATAAVAAHTAASDPHTQYLTPAEASSAYAPLAHVGSGGAAHANAIAAGTAGFMTGADKTKLDGIAVGATQNSADATLLARANHTGTQTASTISDFTEATQDVVGSSVVAGANVTVTYDDGTGLTTVAATGGGMANPMTTAGDMIVGGAAGVPTRLPAGSNTQVMTIVGGVPAWSAPAAGGGSLVNFTENLSTSLPNAGTYAARLLPASAGATDIDFAVEPKGAGALLRKIPDGTVAGGAKRGSRATDLQASRSAASQVASGADSFAAGADNTASGAWSCAVGYSNTAAGGYSVVIGYGNLAQQAACVALGQSNSATGAQSVAIGNNNTASGGIAFALGNGCTASGSYAFAVGATCTASGPYSQATGRQATSRGVIGAKAHSSGQQSTLGDAQTIQLVSRAATTGATSTRLTADNTAASAINQVLIPTNSAVKFRGDVVARNTANGDCATWSVSGLIKNVAGTVTLVGTPTATMDMNDTGAAGWTLTVTADNTNKSLALAVVGAAATSIRWVSAINTTEVTA